MNKILKHVVHAAIFHDNQMAENDVHNLIRILFLSSCTSAVAKHNSATYPKITRNIYSNIFCICTSYLSYLLSAQTPTISNYNVQNVQTSLLKRPPVCQDHLCICWSLGWYLYTFHCMQFITEHGM